MITEYDVQQMCDGGPKDIKAPYQSNVTSNGRLVDVQWTSDWGPKDIYVTYMTFFEGLKWTLVLVLFG